MDFLADPLVGKIAVAVLGLLVLALAVRLGHRVALRYLTVPQTARRARGLVTFLGYLLAIGLVASIFREKLGGLTLAFGVAGAGIAFALQEVIASVGGWVAISFGTVYKIGDRVEVAGIRGDVIEVGLLRTTLMEMGEWVRGDQYTGRIVRVSNSAVLKEAVYNYSADFPFLWEEIQLPIKYGSDHDLAWSILEDAAEELLGDYARQAEHTWNQIIKRYALEPMSVRPRVTMMLNDNWIELTLRYVTDYRRRRTTKSALFKRLLDEINATEGKVSLASATFELVDAPRLSIGLREFSGSGARLDG